MNYVKVYPETYIMDAYENASQDDVLLVYPGAIWPDGSTVWLRKPRVSLQGIASETAAFPDGPQGVLRLGNGVHDLSIAGFFMKNHLMQSNVITRNISYSDLDFSTGSIYINDGWCNGLQIQRVKIREGAAAKKAIRIQRASNVLIEDCVVNNYHSEPQSIPNCLYLEDVHGARINRFFGVHSYFLQGHYYQGDCIGIERGCLDIALENVSAGGAGDAALDCKVPIVMKNCTFWGAKRIVRLWAGARIEDALYVRDAHPVGDGMSLAGLWNAGPRDAIEGHELVQFHDCEPEWQDNAT